MKSMVVWVVELQGRDTKSIFFAKNYHIQENYCILRMQSSQKVPMTSNIDFSCQEPPES